MTDTIDFIDREHTTSIGPFKNKFQLQLTRDVKKSSFSNTLKVTLRLLLMSTSGDSIHSESEKHGFFKANGRVFGFSAKGMMHLNGYEIKEIASCSFEVPEGTKAIEVTAAIAPEISIGSMYVLITKMNGILILTEQEESK